MAEPPVLDRLDSRRLETREVIRSFVKQAEVVEATASRLLLRTEAEKGKAGRCQDHRADVEGALNQHRREAVGQKVTDDQGRGRGSITFFVISSARSGKCTYSGLQKHTIDLRGVSDSFYCSVV